MKIITIKKDHWIDAVPDGLDLPCSICGCRVDFDYHVDDEFWEKMVPRAYKLGVICLRCLDVMATLKGENVCEHLENVFFCGENKTILLSPNCVYIYNKR